MLMGNQNNLQKAENAILHDQNRVERIRRYLLENLKTDLSASVVAQKFELSISSLQHLFKRYQKQSYHKYLEEIRMEKAFELITKEGKRVKEVMNLTGYKRRITFNRAFKRKYKQSPGHFMK